MNEESSNKIGIEKIAIMVGIATQIGVMIWSISSMKASIDYTKEELKELNTKIEEKLDNIEDRLRDAEREIAILQIIVKSK